jgi:outer membrane protein TolC
MNQARYRRERARPLLPLFVFGYSAGAFGGGGNFYAVNKIAGNTGARTDLDAMAIWNWQNFGLGNIALQKGERAATGAAQAELALVVNEVRREVTESYATLQARERQLEIARQRLTIAHQGFDHDMNLIRNQLNIRPIELLNSVTLLSQARQAFLAALVTFNQAQLDLFVRLGRPPTMACPEMEPVLMPDSAAVNEHKKKLRQEQERAVRP